MDKKKYEAAKQLLCFMKRSQYKDTLSKVNPSLMEFLRSGVEQKDANNSIPLRARRHTFLGDHSMGDIYVCGMGALKGRNLTEVFLLDSVNTKASALHNEYAEMRPMEIKLHAHLNYRLIRQVLVLSDAPSLPDKALFLSESKNGKTFDFTEIVNSYSLSPDSLCVNAKAVLHLRVVGISTGLFTPQRSSRHESDTIFGMDHPVNFLDHNTSMMSDFPETLATERHDEEIIKQALNKHRHQVERMEYALVRDLQVILNAILDIRKGRQDTSSGRECWMSDPHFGSRSTDSENPGEEETRSNWEGDVVKKYSKKENQFIFNLTVPTYYVPVFMRDTAFSRLSEVCAYTNEVLDRCVDANGSLMMPSTFLLSQLILLSGLPSFNQEKVEEEAHHCVEGIQIEAPRREMSERLDQLIESLCVYAADILESPRWKYSRQVRNEDSRITFDGRVYALFTNKQMNTPFAIGPETYDQGCSDEIHSSESKLGEGCATQLRNYLLLHGGMDRALRSIDQKKILFPLPSVLVHCVQGVSRSPSVVMVYFMHRYKEVLREISLLAKSTSCDDKNNKKSFAAFLAAIRNSRSVVDPNICFLTEMKSMWEALTSS